MKKNVVAAGLVLVLCSMVFAAEPKISANWHKKNPSDSKDFMYRVGMSDSRSTEKSAVDQAWTDVLSKFASSISTLYTGQTENYSMEEGMESDVLDAYTFTVSSSNWKSRVPLFGVKLLDKRVEKDSSGKYVAYVLACISVQDYNRSKIAVADEETSVLAYRYFEQHLADSSNFRKIDTDDETYYQWLRSNCVVVQCDSKDAGKDKGKSWADLYAQFLSKTFRHIILYRCSIEDINSVVVYNNPDYSQKIAAALEGTLILSVTKNGSLYSISSTKNNSSFAKYIADMKDSGKVIVSGKEVFNLPSGATHDNTGNKVVKAFAQLAHEHLKLICTVDKGSYDSPDDMVSYVCNNSEKYTARYVVYIETETMFSEEDTTYNIKPMVDAYSTITLYDMITGEHYTSDTAQSMPGAFPITRLTDDHVISKSRTALDNITNPAKNPEGLLHIMENLFNTIE